MLKFLFPTILIIFQLISAQKVGVLWVGKSGMTNDVIAGFKEKINLIAPEIEISFSKELPTIDSAKTIFNQYIRDMDGIIFLRSSGAKFLSKQKMTKPGFIGGCNNPVSLNVVNSLDAPPNKNITGVTYYIKTQYQFMLFKMAFTEINSVCLILEKDHPGSIIDKFSTEMICSKSKIKYHEIYASNIEDIKNKIESLKSKVDIFIIGSEALCMDNAQAITDASFPKPVVAYSKKAVKNGALLGYSANDKKLGSLLAESVSKVLKDGKKVSEVPIKTDTKPKVFVNMSTLKKLNINLPKNVIGSAVKFN